MFKIFLTSLILCSTSFATNYPSHWWKEVPKSELKSWEISPHTAKRDVEVVLSKRNELGILSNFASTPIAYDGKTYKSLEGFWQAMKYPESKDDPRYNLAEWPHTRSEVEQMIGSKAKRAGSFASEVMKSHNINWVTYKGEKMPYRVRHKGKHYNLILNVMRAKLQQNANVESILKSTGQLVLLPDHKTKPNDPPAWKYFDNWMIIRQELIVNQ